MTSDQEFNKQFFAAYPRWRFHNCWKGHDGMYGFGLFGIWWSVGGSMGITVLNFGLEFNPHHRESV